MSMKRLCLKALEKIESNWCNVYICHPMTKMKTGNIHSAFNLSNLMYSFTNELTINIQ